MAKTKAGGGTNWVGTTADETWIGTDGSDIIRGSGGDDDLTGGNSSDRFVFESTLEANGVDVIQDFAVKGSASPYNPDVIDLSLALSKGVTSKNVNDYVYVAGDKLYVDLDGTGAGNPEVWAILKGVEQGDQVNVRTKGFDGWITARAPQEPTSYYISVDKGGAWFDLDENGIKDDTETYIQGYTPVGNFYTINGIDMDADDVTIRFTTWNTLQPLDLSGFGAGDKLILDAKTNASSYLGGTSKFDLVGLTTGDYAWTSASADTARPLATGSGFFNYAGINRSFSTSGSTYVSKSGSIYTGTYTESGSYTADFRLNKNTNTQLICRLASGYRVSVFSFNGFTFNTLYFTSRSFASSFVLAKGLVRNGSYSLEAMLPSV